MGKAHAKKKKAEKPVEATAVVKEATKAGMEFVFISRDKSKEMKMAAPMEGNKASDVLFDVLNRGPLPNGLKLQWADSYLGHFVNRKGKNACGASNIKDLLVVNGIADELAAAGVKGVVQPTAKPYKAIKLNHMSREELRDLANKIAMILGFTKKAKKETAETVSEAV